MLMVADFGQCTWLSVMVTLTVTGDKNCLQC